MLTGEFEGRALPNSGGKSHQAIEVLLRDLYQPFRIASLFAELFPGEHFDIVNSPARVHQILRRTRRWIASENLPVEIVENAGFYSLHLTGEIAFRLPLERRPVEHMNLYFHSLKELFSDGSYFTAGDVRRKLEISKTTAFRLLTWAQDQGVIERSGSSARRTKYKIAA